MDDKTTLKVVAIAGLTVLESVNLAIKGIDGALFGGVIIAIAGLAGYTIGKVSK